MASLLKLDQMTCYGRNLRNISDDCNAPIEELSKANVKKLMSYKVVPDNELWRARLVDELLGARLGSLEVPLEKDEIETVLSFACSS